MIWPKQKGLQARGEESRNVYFERFNDNLLDHRTNNLVVDVESLAADVERM
jgi:hypothetical protein